MAAVIHAAASLEAFLNEELEKIAVLREDDWDATIDSLDRLDIKEKWVVFPKFLFGNTFNRGARPYQDFVGLIDLRNTLVHYRPKTETANFVPPKVERLRGRFVFDAHENQSWTSKVLNRSCARWACTTARDMVQEYFKVTGQEARWPTEEQMVWALSLIDGVDPVAQLLAKEKE